VANALLDATPLMLWLALAAASGRRALVTAENYERIVFGCAMLCLGFRYLSAFFGSRDFQAQDTPALSEPWVPPELLPSFLLVGGLMRVVLLFVSAIVVMGLQPTAALAVSLTDAAGTLMRLFRSQIFVALPPIGPAPAWVVYLLLLGVNIGVIFCCALYHAGLEQRTFSLHQELQTAKNDRIEQLAGEKERLQYDYAFAARAASRSTPRANALARSGQHPADDESDGVDASLPQLPDLRFSFIAHSSSSLTSSVAEAFMQSGQTYAVSEAASEPFMCRLLRYCQRKGYLARRRQRRVQARPLDLELLIDNNVAKHGSSCESESVC